MHHMRVLFREHELLDPHRSVLTDTPQIVATQIHQHQMLGPLLLILEQFFFKCLLFCRIAATPAGTRDGTILKVRSLNTDQHLRRRAGDAHILTLEKEHIGRRIQKTKGSIDVKGIARIVGFKTLGEHHLENVSGRNVFLGLFHGGVKTFMGKAGSDFLG